MPARSQITLVAWLHQSHPHDPADGARQDPVVSPVTRWDFRAFFGKGYSVKRSFTSEELEKLYPVAKAIEMATGIRPSPMQVHRYTTRNGSAGIVLPTVFLGGRKLSYLSDVVQWIADVTAKRQTMTRTVTSVKPSSDAKRHSKSEAFLKREGV